MISSMFSGFNSLIKDFIPALSSWKTPSVFPWPIISYTLASSKSIFWISNSSPSFFRIIRTASWITVRVRSPRKSIFSRPSSSMVVMVNCVVTTLSAPRDRGTNSSKGSEPITTPAAWMEVCRGKPSSLMDISIRFLTPSSAS